MNKISQTVPLQFDTIFSPFMAVEFDAALNFLEECGFTGVEIAIARPNEVDAEALLEKLITHKLSATTISTGQAYALDGLCMCSSDKDVQRASIDCVKGHVDLSAKIGRPPVTIGLLRGKLEVGDKTVLLDNFREAIMPCIEHAAKQDVILQIEPICKEECVLINSTYDALEFIESLGNPENVGILYDTFHSNREDGGMAEAIRTAAVKITNVHFADSHRGLPGYGDIDFGTVVETLRSVGYCGAYALETLVTPDKEFINRHCYDSISSITKSK